MSTFNALEQCAIEVLMI